MFAFLVDSAVTLLFVGGIASGEVWLRHHRAGEEIRVAHEIATGTTLYRRERLADSLRSSLTKEDVVFLRTNGWEPPTPLRALAAGVQPAPGLGLSAIEAPKLRDRKPPPRPARPHPAAPPRAAEWFTPRGTPEIYDSSGRKIV